MEIVTTAALALGAGLFIGAHIVRVAQVLPLRERIKLLERKLQGGG